MKVLNDYYCTQCGIINEHFLENDVDQTICHVCGGDARKVISAVNFQLEGTSGHFPTAADKWVKKREQKMKEERKRDSD